MTTRYSGGEMRGSATLLVAALALFALVCGSVIAVPTANAADHHTVVVTFVRHGESAANAAGIIDTAVPGPDLTALGNQQAQRVADELSVNRYDGIYASTVVRTQETAAPMSQALGEDITVLPGLREIDAGSNEGLSVADAPVYPAPKVWLKGDRNARIPGAISGTEFEARFNDAMNTIYRSGETNPVVFSHGLAILYWVLMNVKNTNLALADTALPNTAHVVVTGNPTDGWTLVNWNGAPAAA
jgi:broad specificity phosphatase PhoE